MEIIRVTNEKLKLILDSADMKKYGITERALSSDNGTRRRALFSLLEDLQKRTGLDAKGRRTLLEAFPDPAGGCEIFLTVLGDTKERHMFYRFSSLSHLSSAVRCLEGKVEGGESALYALAGNGYVLVLPPPAQTCGDAYAFLSEYGKEETGVHFLPYVREYGTCLCEKDALSYILREKENFSV